MFKNVLSQNLKHKNITRSIYVVEISIKHTPPSFAIFSLQFRKNVSMNYLVTKILIHSFTAMRKTQVSVKHCFGGIMGRVEKVEQPWIKAISPATD